MSPFAASCVVLACVLGGALAGMAIQRFVPDHHVSNANSRDVVKLGLGVISMLSALVLGLLIASAKGSYDRQAGELEEMAANVLILDRVLAHYGPETGEIRGELRRAIVAAADRIWPEAADATVDLGPIENRAAAESFLDGIASLNPQSDAQRAMQAQALRIGVELGQMRFLLLAQHGSTLATPFLIVLVLWLTVIFTTFGLLAPRNATVSIVLLVCALSVAAAVFLLLELDAPYQGMVRISGAPIREALSLMGR